MFIAENLNPATLRKREMLSHIRPSDFDKVRRWRSEWVGRSLFSKLKRT
jgi:hypothetical protein